MWLVPLYGLVILGNVISTASRLNGDTPDTDESHADDLSIQLPHTSDVKVITMLGVAALCCTVLLRLFYPNVSYHLP